MTIYEAARAVLAGVEGAEADPRWKGAGDHGAGRGTLAARLLMRFQALTCVRPGEAREARWSEVDGALWVIPGERMKSGRPHEVAAIAAGREVLDVARAVLADGGPFVFPARHRGLASAARPLTRFPRWSGETCHLG